MSGREVLMTRLDGWDRVPVAALYLPIVWTSWDNLFGSPGTKGRVRNDTIMLGWSCQVLRSACSKVWSQDVSMGRIFWIAEVSACSKVSHFFELRWLGGKATFLARTWLRTWIIQHPGILSRWSRSCLLGRLRLAVHAQNLRSHEFSCVTEKKKFPKKGPNTSRG